MTVYIKIELISKASLDITDKDKYTATYAQENIYNTYKVHTHVCM